MSLEHESKPSARRRTLRIFLIQLVVSLGLLFLVYGSADLGTFFRTLGSVSYTSIALVSFLYLLGQVISAYKWRFLVLGVGIERSFPETLSAYFLGMFVNVFGLGTVGGDVVRSVALKALKGKRAAALGTAVADRIHGLTVLASIGTFALLFVQPNLIGSLAIPAAIFLVIALSLAWLFGPKLLTRIFPAEHRFGRVAREVATAFPQRFSTIASITVISLIFHSIQIMMHFYIARELGASLSLAYLFATVPFINIASAMPISINGLGIREAMYLFLFVPAGVSHEAAVAFGAIWMLIVTAVSAVGGLIAAPRSTRLLINKEALRSSSLTSSTKYAARQ